MESMEMGVPRSNIESLKNEYLTKRKRWFEIQDRFSKSAGDGTLPPHQSDEYGNVGEDFEKLNGQVIDLMKKLEDTGINIDELEAMVQQERGQTF